MKRVTDPLNDKVKARITGFSSGSEHSADGTVFSPTFTDLFFNFGEEEANIIPEDDIYETRVDNHHSLSTDLVTLDSVKAILNVQLDYEPDSFKKGLLGHILKALQVFSCVKSSREVLQRNVMAYLRSFGFDAAICKTMWESSGGLTGGNYEFIDAIRQDNRYFIGLDFASEFGIARPTESYERLRQLLPKVFIGKMEELKQILKLMSDAAKRSLKSRGLLLPPWRKHRFMENKWMGPYRRTTNLFPATFAAKSLSFGGAVKCRAVGFDVGGGGGGGGEGGLMSSTARTR